MSTKDELQREEVRGILVLGVIASLLGVKDSLGLAVDFSHFTYSSVLVILILYWGTYVTMMAVGVSSDLFDERFAARCATLARFMFVGGVWTLVMAVLSVPLAYLFSIISPGDLAVPYAVSVSSIITGAVFQRIGGFKRFLRRSP